VSAPAAAGGSASGGGAPLASAVEAAIVAEDETSTYISASFAAHIDASGCIVMDRKDA
jgi:N-methylhydantoinase A